MPAFNLETYDTSTGARITSYTKVEGEDTDDACAILRADLASYPEYLQRGETSWNTRTSGE